MAAVSFGNQVWRRPRGRKIRRSSCLATLVPVTRSISSPATTWLVLE